MANPQLMEFFAFNSDFQWKPIELIGRIETICEQICLNYGK